MSIKQPFPTQITWQFSRNVIKVLWWRFQQCLGTFTMLLVEGSSEKSRFRHLSNHVFRVRISEIQKLWGWSFISKCSKLNLDFKNAAKKREKVFCFSDNCISIGIVKFSLLRTGYFSSVANVLTRGPKIWHVNKWDFLQHNFVASDQWIC